MQPRREQDSRTRCKRHGLVVNRDRACPLCTAGKASLGRIAIATLLIAICTAAVAMAVRWQLARSRTDGETSPGDGLDEILEDRVRLARPDEATPATVTRYEPVAPEQQDQGEEDTRLGKPILQHLTVRPAPPAPPRASVDPEPRAPDDPRDFEQP